MTHASKSSLETVTEPSSIAADLIQTHVVVEFSSIEPLKTLEMTAHCAVLHGELV